MQRTREDYRRELAYWRRDAPPARERGDCPACGRDGILLLEDGRLWPHKGMTLPLTDCHGQEAA